MMKTLATAAVAALGLTIGQPAWSILIDGVEVGGVDIVVAVTDDLDGSPGTSGCPNGSNPDAEECWAEIVAALDLDFELKTETVPIVYEGTLGAFALAEMPEYYIVKNAQAWVLMQNVDDLSWGVLDTSDPDLNDFKLNLGKPDQATISHVTEFNGGNKVSEPAGLALLGIGLVGFGLSRRRKQTA